MEYREARATEARRLRTAEGMSSQAIREKLGVGKSQLQYWLAGLPTSQGLRPQARDDLKARARGMRTAGNTYDEIVTALGVSQSSVSLWVRDIPVERDGHPGWTAEARQRRTGNLAKKHAHQDIQHLRHRQQLQNELGPYHQRDVLIAGAMAYWCEGAKVKPWRRNPCVQFINTDPALVRLFLHFLSLVPVPHGGPVFRLHIHESADEDIAKRYWREAVGADVFKATQWKRHKPSSNRKNQGADYQGCLEVYAKRSAKLYWYIENLAKAAMKGMADAGADWRQVS